MRLDPYVRFSLIVLVGALLVLALLQMGCGSPAERKVLSTTEVFYSSSSGSWDGSGGFKGGGDVVRGVMDGDADSHTIGVSIRPLAALYDEHEETRALIMATRQRPPDPVTEALPEENDVGCLMGMTHAARQAHNAKVEVKPHDDTKPDAAVDSSHWWEWLLKIGLPVALAGVGGTLEVRRRRKKKAESTNPVR